MKPLWRNLFHTMKKVGKDHPKSIDTMYYPSPAGTLIYRSERRTGKTGEVTLNLGGQAVYDSLPPGAVDEHGLVP